MAKRKPNPAKDFIELISLAPWWVGILLAALAYVTLHRIATTPSVPVVAAGDLAGGLVGIVIGAFSQVGQYLVPAICLMGSVTSAWRGRNRRQLIERVSALKDGNPLESISWQEFEMLTGEAFRQQGYAVVETGGNGPDGGIDLVLRRDGQKYYVQCKQWKVHKVTVQVVRELFGVMASGGAIGGCVVTSGTYTSDAIAFARGKNLRLISGPELFEMIRQARKRLDLHVPLQSAQSTAPSVVCDSLCPLCQSDMTRRMARKGANAGSQFLGCTKYPSCKGTRDLPIS